jgi:hypothetical protein
MSKTLLREPYFSIALDNDVSSTFSNLIALVQQSLIASTIIQIDFAFVSTIFLLDFRTGPTV